jgi:hypothetical protein
LRAKYPKELADKLINTNTAIQKIALGNNDGFSIQIEHRHFMTKNKNEATTLVHLDKEASEGITIIKELKDPNKTHKYTMKACNKEITARLKRRGMNIEFNQYMFQLFVAYFGIKESEKFCYINTVGTTPTYQYSYATIEFIFEEYMKDPENIIKNLKARSKKGE